MGMNGQTFTAELQLGRTDDPNRELFRFWRHVLSKDKNVAYKYLSGCDYDSAIAYIRNAIVKANTNLASATARVDEQMTIKHYKYLDQLMERIQYISSVIVQCEVYIMCLEYHRHTGKKFSRQLLMQLSTLNWEENRVMMQVSPQRFVQMIERSAKYDS